MISLTPINGGCPNYGTSTLKSISFFLLFIGIIFVTVGYIQEQKNSVLPKIEYRYIPRTFEEEQLNQEPINSIFGSMFTDRDPRSKQYGYIDTYPWQRQLIDSKTVLPYQGITGLGRYVGHRTNV